ADGQARPAFAAQLDNRPESFDGSGPQFERGFFGDEFATISIVGIRQQGLDRHLDEFGIAVEFFTIGERELGSLDLYMDEIRAGRMKIIEAHAFEQRQLLEQDRSLAPDSGLADGIATVI